MARCVFENLTIEQAKALAQWFEEQGEQDCIVWFEESDLKSPFANRIEHYDDEIVVWCK
jgi:hypothetical protein